MLGHLIFCSVFAGSFAADQCEQGWLTSLGSKSCYKMIDGTTFWAAEGKCVEEGAHLTSILTDEENQAIYGLMQKNIPNYDAWVGGILMTRGDNTQIYWMDGTPVDPNMGLWKGIPPKYDMERFCVQKNKDGVMQQSLCGAQLKGICKRPIGHAPVPLVKPVCDEGWKGSKFTGSCYKLTGKITKSGDAQEECFAADAQPASVLSFLEKEFILDLAKQANTTAVWLGARRGTNGRFEWIDQSKWDNAYWSVTGPSTSGTDKNCLVLFGKVDNDATILHRWAEHDCGGTAMGVCKKPGKPKA